MTKNGVGFTNNYKKMASNIEVNKKYENIFGREKCRTIKNCIDCFHDNHNHEAYNCILNKKKKVRNER